MTEFNYEVEVDVRFRDLDSMGHVNNAVYATYFEHARTLYMDDVFGDRPEEINVALVNLNIDFKRQVRFGESVTVGVGVTELGDSSVTMEYEVRTGDELAATGSTILVAIDDEGNSRSMPESVREGIREYEGL
ncbi:acyl-CoA thioesterase [Halovenus sp. WSH3]|uniref:Acyl-CoA thioesterase n=1 Tax=Halovenus carboxidivorans TaxID=2692199 RepID=A0A6B0TBZ8_9EURY|nr:thioesterase family protein [Halovenus carboxidivorans]MXR50729.1 acyl-CoA thioesterase [Halovenus carboxidivorans]